MRKAITIKTLKVLASSIGFAFIHYAVFSVIYVRVEVLHSLPGHGLWWAILGFLGFPLGYLNSFYVDVFPIAMAANSLLWGVACATAVVGLPRLVQSRSGRIHTPAE